MPKGKILMGKTPKPVPGGKPTPGKQLPKRGPVKPRTPTERKFIEEQLRENPRRGTPRGKGGMVNPGRKNITPSMLQAKQAGSSYLSNSTANKPAAKPAAKPARRPQLDKMSPGTGKTNTTARYYLGDGKYKTVKEKISGATADRYNAEDAYYGNRENVRRFMRTDRVKTKNTRTGGK